MKNKIFKKLTISLSAMLAGVTPLSLIASCSSNDAAPVAKNFLTDSWETVCYYANKGFDALYKAYENTKTFVDNNRTFVGLNRYVPWNGIDHSVMVIGEKQDFIADDSGNPTKTFAALTFQFDNALSRKSPSSSHRSMYTNVRLAYHKNAKKQFANEYADSDLRRALEDPISGTIAFFPENVRKNIKTVSKRSLSKFERPGIYEKIINLSSKVFCLSLSEIYNVRCFSSDFYSSLHRCYLYEGIQYDYYKKLITRDDAPVEHMAELCRNVCSYPGDPVVTPSAWLLRSPFWRWDPKDIDTMYALSIDNTGKINGMFPVSDDRNFGCAPAFCI